MATLVLRLKMLRQLAGYMQWPIGNPLIPCIERVIEMQSGLRRRLETPIQLEMGV